MTACRSCGAEIVWARTTKNHKNIPLDAEPVEWGTTAAFYSIGTVPTDRGGQMPLVTMNKESPDVDASWGARVSHYTTCPDADEHRANARRYDVEKARLSFMEAYRATTKEKKWQAGVDSLLAAGWKAPQ